MPSKTLYYAQLYEDMVQRLTASPQDWTGYLRIAGHLYKYSYPDQIMIYAQRPDATACAGYDLWNDRMNRYIRRGSKGIALLDDSGDKLRLRYVFDVSDTGTRPNSRSPWLWELEDGYSIPAAAALQRKYNFTENDFDKTVYQVAKILADSYWAEHQQDCGNGIGCQHSGTNHQKG